MSPSLGLSFCNPRTPLLLLLVFLVFVGYLSFPAPTPPALLQNATAVEGVPKPQDVVPSTTTTTTKPRIAVINIAIPESSALNPIVAENTRQYCARWGHDLATATTQYPLFSEPHLWEIPATVFGATRAALSTGNYDWVLYKQADTMFVNMDLSLEAVIERVPRDKHIVLSACMGYWANDVAVLFRNSPQAMKSLDELIELQTNMSTCGAPGMGAFNEWMLRKLDGELSPLTGKYERYAGECSTSCDQQNTTSRSGWFGYQSLFTCFEGHLKRFGRGLWHVRTEDIPGVWLMPASDAFVLRDGRHPVADDLGGFCNSRDGRAEGLVPQGMEKFAVPNVRLMFARIATDPCFCKRFPTTLALHIGGGGGADRAIKFVEDLRELFPQVRYTSTSWNISSDTVRGEWTLGVQRLELSQEPVGSSLSNMTKEAFANGTACECLRKLINKSTCG